MKLVTTTSVHLTPEERALMRERRRATGIKAYTFAHLAGCSVTALYAWESGHRHPSLEAYERWHAALENPAPGLRTITLAA